MSEQKKINVLHLRSLRGPGGGPEKTILFSAVEVDSSQFNMHIVYLKSENDPDFDLDKRAKQLGIDNFITINEHHKFDRKALKQLLGILREHEIDILHCHCYKSDLYGLILSKFHKMRLMTTAHGPLATLQFFWRSQNWRVRYLYDQVDLRILRFFDKVLMVSDTMRRFIARHGVAEDKLIWIRNAIDGNYFAKTAVDVSYKESLGIPADSPVVGAVGRLNGEKDYPTFLQSAKLLLEKQSNLHFVIAGGGALEEELKAHASELNLNGNVHFLGHIHDVRKVYNILDAYVLSSTREGLPNTVLEAMAMEVPIVATTVDGVVECVEDGKEARLVPPMQPDKLAEQVEVVLNDVNLKKDLTQAARQRVERDFSFANRMRTIEKFYKELSSQHPS